MGASLMIISWEQDFDMRGRCARACGVAPGRHEKYARLPARWTTIKITDSDVLSTVLGIYINQFTY